MSRMLTPELEALRAKTREFAREVLAPRRLESEDPAFLMEMGRLLGKEGLLRTVVPTEAGGAGLGTMGGVLVIEELARECPAVALAAMNQMLIPLNMLWNPAAKERWFEGMLAGEMMAGIAFTDPVGIVNYAEQPEIGTRDGEDYILNGVRYYVGIAPFADLIVVGGLIDGDMRSFWLDAAQPGLSVSDMPRMGLGSPWGCVELKDARVAPEFVTDLSMLVKNRELANIKGAGTASTHYITALALGLAEGVWEKTDNFVRERTVRREPLAAMQAVQHRMVRMRQNIEASRSMLYDASQLVDGGQGDTVLDHLVKPFVTEMAVDVAQECVTLHGGRGYLRSAGIELYLRDAVGTLIGECTSEMHYSTVATVMEYPGAQPGAF